MAELPSLIVLGGSMAGTRLVLEDAVDNILIGSDPSCRFVINLPGVSPIHARLWVDTSGITIYDTNSPRGLFVNDERVSGQLELHNGDIIWLGTPGDDEVVMIQCRMPGGTSAPGVRQPTGDATLMFVPPPPEVPPGVPPVATADMAATPAETTDPAPEDALEATVVDAPALVAASEVLDESVLDESVLDMPEAETEMAAVPDTQQPHDPAPEVGTSEPEPEAEPVAIEVTEAGGSAIVEEVAETEVETPLEPPDTAAVAASQFEPGPVADAVPEGEQAWADETASLATAPAAADAPYGEIEPPVEPVESWGVAEAEVEPEPMAPEAALEAEPEPVAYEPVEAEVEPASFTPEAAEAAEPEPVGSEPVDAIEPTVLDMPAPVPPAAALDSDGLDETLLAGGAAAAEVTAEATDATDATAYDVSAYNFEPPPPVAALPFLPTPAPLGRTLPPEAEREPVRFAIDMPKPAPAAVTFEDEMEATVVSPPVPLPPMPSPIPEFEEDPGVAQTQVVPNPLPPAVPAAASEATVLYPAAATARPAPPPATPRVPPAPAVPPMAVTPPTGTPRPSVPAKPAPPAPRPATPTPAARAATPPPAPRKPVTPAPAAVTVAAPPPAVAPPPPAAAGSKLPLFAGLGLVAVVVLAGGGYFAYQAMNPAPQQVAVPPTAPPLPPTTIAAPPPSEPPTSETVAPVEEEITTVPSTTLAAKPSTAPSVKPSPSPTPKATPTPATGAKPTTAPATPDPAAAKAAQVAGLIGQADVAAGAKNWDAALALYDEVLKLDPQNAHVAEARKTAVAQRDASKRTFVSSRTTVQTAKASKADVTGFDSADVNLQKAPDFLGRIEFSMTPTSIKAGDSYSLKVYLVNEGKKEIKIAGMTVTTSVNGTGSGGPVAPRIKEVAPQQRVLLEDLPGVWKDGVNAWSSEVLVTANKGDSLKAKLTWK